MSKLNETIDRIRAIRQVSRDDLINQLIPGTVEFDTKDVRRLTTFTSFKVMETERNVHDFFTTREGLCLSQGFQTFIVHAAKKGPTRVNSATMTYADLAEFANDDEIIAELPKGYIFTASTVFLGMLAGLIEAQWHNKAEGPLQGITFHPNIFYVKIAHTIFTVSVSFDSLHGWWFCDAKFRNKIRWFAQSRVFCAVDT